MNELTDALTLMAKSIANLADAQTLIIEKVSSIEGTLKAQNRAVTAAMERSKNRAAEVVAAAAKLSKDPTP